MSRSLKTFLVIVLPLFALVVGMRLGVAYDRWMGGTGYQDYADPETGSGTVLTDPEKEADLSLMWEVWRLLQRHYIDPDALTSQALIEGAVGGLVAGVGDPYTAFMPARENSEFHQALQGTLQGVGAELTLKEGMIVVVSPLRGSPAERAGLLPDDIVTHVDGQSLEGLTLDETVSRIRGEKGTKVTLTLLRSSVPEPIVLTIQRDNVTVPSVEWKVLSASGSQIGYVALNQFGENSMKEVRQALRQIKDKPLKGLVLDLRNNGGGYLEGAVELASMFLKEGEVVEVQSRGGEVERHKAYGEPVLPDLPLAVLINQASASAAEIVPGALQDNGRATIVGMTSYGKGTVQEIIELPGGGSLRVTVARWLTPKGKNLAKEGVVPDVKVERQPGDIIGKKDAQLEAALKVLLP
ncbi:MAG: S41 family peptidase [Candidatus Peribacteraceae bacterium]|jgi:carboxyl-terminal processing protease